MLPLPASSYLLSEIESYDGVASVTLVPESRLWLYVHSPSVRGILSDICILSHVIACGLEQLALTAVIHTPTSKPRFVLLFKFHYSFQDCKIYINVTT